MYFHGVLEKKSAKQVTEIQLGDKIMDSKVFVKKFFLKN